MTTTIAITQNRIDEIMRRAIDALCALMHESTIDELISMIDDFECDNAIAYSIIDIIDNARDDSSIDIRARMIDARNA